MHTSTEMLLLTTHLVFNYQLWMGLKYWMKCLFYILQKKYNMQFCVFNFCSNLISNPNLFCVKVNLTLHNCYINNYYTIKSLINVSFPKPSMALYFVKWHIQIEIYKYMENATLFFFMKISLNFGKLLSQLALWNNMKVLYNNS